MKIFDRWADGPARAPHLDPVNESIFFQALLVVTGLLLACSAAFSQVSASDHFTVNAQYRGAVKKAFQGIGSGQASYSGSPSNFTLRAVGNVTHPQRRGTVFQFGIDMHFSVVGHTINVVSQRNSFNAEAQIHRDKMVRVAPFIFLARQLPPPREGEEPTREYRYQGEEYQLRYHRTERQYEVELVRGGQSEGKFFLSPDWAPGNEGLEKFRAPLWQENVMVSFVIN